MKILLGLSCLLLTACGLDLEEVRMRESSCKVESGEVVRVMDGGRVSSIYCIVDGVTYWVAPSGNLK